MERLTSYESECKREMICRYEDCDTCEEYCPYLNEDNCPCLQEMIEKLAHYEDLQEQNKLLILPCAVGDTVYVIELDEENFTSFHAPKKISEYEFNLEMVGLIELFGKCIFLTKEQAEAALKEMEGKE